MTEMAPAEDGSIADLDGGVIGGCPSGAYDDDADAATDCVAWTACEAGEYVSAEGTLTTDQTCAGCVSGTFSTSANATECVPWTTCVAGTAVMTQGSATVDQTCAWCGTGTHTSDDNQSMCLAGDACAAGSMQLEPASPTRAAVCEPCAAGEYCAGGDMARTNCDDGDGTWDHDADPSTTCAERTTCTAGSAIASEGDATTDRSCEACESGSSSAESNAASCAEWSTCAPGEYVSNTPSATQDRTCSACAIGEYSTMSNAANCSVWATCAAGDSVATAGTSTMDRTCEACVSGSFSATNNAASCSRWADCMAGDFVSTPGSAMNDRACTACTLGTFTSGPNQSVCLDAEACAAGSIEIAPGTSTSAPTCAACSAGEYCAGDTASVESCDDSDGTWDHDANPATVCVVRTICSAGTFVATEGDATNDRTCTVCVSGEYSTTTNSLSCSEWTTCSPGTYADNTPSATVDRTCPGCTAILDCASGLSCTNDTDQTCGACGPGYALESGDTICALQPWPRQFGTTVLDAAWSVAVDGEGNVYVAGNTYGDLEGINAGSRDVFVRKYSSEGTALWTWQFGTTESDHVRSVAVDGSGNVYVAGNTYGDLEGTNLGDTDVFVRKYSSEGTVLWTSQFGTATYDYASSMTVDGSGSVYVAGYTQGDLEGTNLGGNDAFVRGYSSAGIVLGTQQFGTTSEDVGNSVAVSGSGNVYVVGHTDGVIEDGLEGGVFVRGYSSAGAVVWTRQFGANVRDSGYSVAVDGDENVYVVGSTEGDLEGIINGWSDVFVRKYSSEGTALWTRQFGTGPYHYGNSVAVDGSGNVYLCGHTEEAGFPEPTPGTFDVIVRKYSGAGDVLWSYQQGTAELDTCYSVVPDGSGNAYVAVSTQSAWPGQASEGQWDAVVARFPP